jgi:hypothetical protein
VLESERKSKVIDGMEVHVTPFAVLAQCGLLARLVKIFAPALTSLGSLDLAKAMSLPLTKLGPMLDAMMGEIVKAEPEKLIPEILSSTYVVTGKGKTAEKFELSDTDDLSRLFQGKLPSLLRTAKYALEVNFADFFPGAGTGEPAQPEA